MSAEYYYNEGKLIEALKELDLVSVLDPNWNRIHVGKFMIYIEQEKVEMAVDQLKKMCLTDSSTINHIDLIDSIFNEKGINGLVRWWIGIEMNRPSISYSFIAQYYALIDEKVLALDMLEKAVELKEFGIQPAINNRLFENMRSEPRFISLLKKMGLEN